MEAFLRLLESMLTAQPNHFVLSAFYVGLLRPVVRETNLMGDAVPVTIELVVARRQDRFFLLLVIVESKDECLALLGSDNCFVFGGSHKCGGVSDKKNPVPLCCEGTQQKYIKLGFADL